MANTTTTPEESKRRKAFQLAADLGLDRDDRIELARVLLWRDITSWGQLSDSQVARILDALEGFTLVAHLLSLKSAV